MFQWGATSATSAYHTTWNITFIVAYPSRVGCVALTKRASAPNNYGFGYTANLTDFTIYMPSGGSTPWRWLSIGY